jgi:predicted ester cyclase
MQETNKTVRQEWLDRINAQDLEGALLLLHPNFVTHTPNREPGVEGVRQFFEMLFAAFPDQHSTTQQLIVEGDHAVHRILIEGTHTGSFMGISPTGKHTGYTVTDLVRFEDGKMVEHWTISDTLGLMQQLGLIPSMG